MTKMYQSDSDFHPWRVTQGQAEDATGLGKILIVKYGLTRLLMSQAVKIWVTLNLIFHVQWNSKLIFPQDFP